VIVLDASAALEVLLNTPAGTRISARIFADGETLHAPHLLDLEVAQVLRRYVLSGDLAAERASQAIDDLMDLRLVGYPHAAFLPRIWELRSRFTAYDAAYLALAEALPATLVTRDRGLAASAGHGAQTELF
jgi:predicted nucleic acid-binding protein